MDTDPIFNRPHVEEPFLRFQDDYLRGSQCPPACEEIKMLDGLPAQHFDHSLARATASTLNKEPVNLIHISPLLASQSQVKWSTEPQLHFEMPHPGCYFDPSQVGVGGNGQSFIHRAPATVRLPYEPLVPASQGSRISLYVAEEANLHSNDSVEECCRNAGGSLAYEMCTDTRGLVDHRMRNTLKIEGQLESASPYAFEYTPPVTDLSSWKSSENGEIDDTVYTYGERSSDEPYAKLIYRALLGAPNHSMVLQDVYRWFLHNTDKGKSTSAGWRNSIRHNLSMNKAFRKAERTVVGDDTKKISEWVLEPWAIENGVTPTTRYRKSGKKPVKSNNPASSRVRSGRAGGLSAGKTKFQRQKPRRGRQEVLVETPIDYGTGMWRQGNPMLAAVHCNSPSPSTPIKQELTSPETASISCIPRSTFSYHVPLPEHMKASFDAPWSFQDIKQVHTDDGPMFYKGEHEHFGDNISQLWSYAHY